MMKPEARKITPADELIRQHLASQGGNPSSTINSKASSVAQDETSHKRGTWGKVWVGIVAVLLIMGLSAWALGSIEKRSEDAVRNTLWVDGYEDGVNATVQCLQIANNASTMVACLNYGQAFFQNETRGEGLL